MRVSWSSLNLVLNWTPKMWWCSSSWDARLMPLMRKYLYNEQYWDGWVTNQIPPFHYFPSFSPLRNHCLSFEYIFHAWQVSSQLHCQIWMWFKESKKVLLQDPKFPNGLALLHYTLDMVFNTMIGQFQTVIWPTASPWSSVRNFPYYPLTTIELRG